MHYFNSTTFKPWNYMANPHAIGNYYHHECNLPSRSCSDPHPWTACSYTVSVYLPPYYQVALPLNTWLSAHFIVYFRRLVITLLLLHLSYSPSTSQTTLPTQRKGYTTWGERTDSSSWICPIFNRLFLAYTTMYKKNISRTFCAWPLSLIRWNSQVFLAICIFRILMTKSALLVFHALAPNSWVQKLAIVLPTLHSLKLRWDAFPTPTNLSFPDLIKALEELACLPNCIDQLFLVLLRSWCFNDELLALDWELLDKVLADRSGFPRLKKFTIELCAGSESTKAEDQAIYETLKITKFPRLCLATNNYLDFKFEVTWFTIPLTTILCFGRYIFLNLQVTSMLLISSTSQAAVHLYLVWWINLHDAVLEGLLWVWSPVFQVFWLWVFL